jgi:hypothetical protein
MRSQDSQGEEIPYRSNVDATPADRVLPEDEEDFTTLKQVFVIIADAKKKASNISTIDLKHPVLTAEQQIAAYQFALNEVILPAEQLLMDTISEIKLKQRGIVNG